MTSKLDSLFRPRTIAIVGASEKSRWAQMALRNITSLGFTGEVIMVNRSGGEVFGQKAFRSCVDYGKPIDIALVLVPAGVTAMVFDDLGAAGVKNAVLLAGGFAESGEEGRKAQEEVGRQAKKYGIRVIGPNCLGFANFIDRAAVWTGTFRHPIGTGSIAVISQSGAVGGAIHHYAAQQGIDLAAIVSTGNELDIDVCDSAGYFVEQPEISVLALFIETARNPAAFKQVAARARELGKPVVILKVGRSEVTAKAAQAHTGALVGDDKVFDALCRQYGFIRVNSIDELLTTADVASKIGKPAGNRAAIVSISGGLSEICADIAHQNDLPLASLSQQTADRLYEFLPDFATVHCPLDLTGLATNNPEFAEKTIAALDDDPGVDLIVYIFEVPRDDADKTAFAIPVLESIGRGAAACSKPILVLPYNVKTVNESSRDIIDVNAIPYASGGIDLGLAAVARVLKTVIAMRESVPDQGSEAEAPAWPDALPRSEFEAQKFLASFDVPVVPTTLAISREDAAKAAAGLAGPVVLKIASADIAHKSDVGGVRVNVAPSDAANVFDEIVGKVSAALPQAKIDGVLVSPMREPGMEILVGVARDPQWGLVLALAIGGIFVEILGDSSLRLLPVDRKTIGVMLRELRGSKLLQGYRGGEAVDMARLEEVIFNITRAALAAGDRLEALEVNPLRISGSRIEALDALVLEG
ncbi:MAG: acetate--CoA ligase family protein [Rhodobiaceae bacterium]|nr:acetate--CoA ligase family protein [Rhodobiaceae bacterium]MCC0056216.1 acetate--CoA ligase family protein [Rhodobiaceae bacterium]